MRTMVPLLASESLIPGWVVDTAIEAFRLLAIGSAALILAVGAAAMVNGMVKLIRGE